MKDDIPNSMVVVLVLVAILVSVLGTWTIVESSSRTPVHYVDESPKEGKVSLEIIEAPRPSTSSDAGTLSLTIIESEV